MAKLKRVVASLLMEAGRSWEDELVASGAVGALDAALFWMRAVESATVGLGRVVKPLSSKAGLDEEPGEAEGEATGDCVDDAAWDIWTGC